MVNDIDNHGELIGSWCFEICGWLVIGSDSEPIFMMLLTTNFHVIVKMGSWESGIWMVMLIARMKKWQIQLCMTAWLHDLSIDPNNRNDILMKSDMRIYNRITIYLQSIADSRNWICVQDQVM